MLSKRLLSILNLVEKNEVVADVGADHGQLVISLCQKGIVNKAFANDNKLGPFNHLKEAVEDAHLQEKIQISLSSGLDELPTYVNTVIIAGMGGDLICQILSENIDKLSSIATLILSPNTSLYNVRKYVTSIGYHIVKETIVYERHYYEIMRFEKGVAHYDEDDLEYGPLLRREKCAVFQEKNAKRLKEISRLLNMNISKERRIELQREKERIENL